MSKEPDYDKIVNRLKVVFEKNGVKEESGFPFFQKAKPEDLECLLHVYDFFSYWTSVYLNDELNCIKEWVIPEHIIDFYKNYEPCQQPMTEAGISLCNLEQIKEENSCSVLLKYKLLIIATSIGGNPVCLDFNQMKNDNPAVIIIDNADIPPFEEIEEYYSEYEDIEELIHTISTSFIDFLWKYSADEYDDFEDMFLDEDE